MPAITRPDPLEIAAGIMLGRDRGIRELPAAAPGRTRQRLEAVIARALARPPCVVSFSGGRDSSAILALAVAVARRDGYELPIPATLVYPDDPLTTEDEWQHRVIAHLGLRDWERIVADDSLDLVGPVALDTICRHGILYPANAFLHVPIIRLAHHGSLLCGVGGDEVLDSPALPLLRCAKGFERPSRRGLMQTFDALGPGSRERSGREAIAGQPWLRPEAARAAARRAGGAAVALGPRWNIALRRWVADRYYLAISGTLQLIAHDASVHACAPLLDANVMAAIAADGGWAGFATRAAALERFVGDLLPRDVINRQSKAVFTRALRSHATSELLEDWNGEGVDHELVDVESLRATWSRPAPDARSCLLLQQVALARSLTR